MHLASLDHVGCARCASRLELDSLIHDKEIDEGLLYCARCDATFPIVQKLPILWDGIPDYLSSRKALGGCLYRSARTQKMKRFLKASLAAAEFGRDRTHLERRWAGIYQASRRSGFYSVIKRSLDLPSRPALGLEYGCSIGLASAPMSDVCGMVFGVDRSFGALSVAKRSFRKNLDYVVADYRSCVFGRRRFGLVVALNMLDIAEPAELLKRMSRQSDGYMIVSDPYDFDRDNPVARTISAQELRAFIKKMGFDVSAKTRAPSFHPWNLKINDRSTLCYRVDLVVAKRSH